MFTEGLDECTIKWVKQGSDLQVEEPPLVQSPSTEKIGCDPFPKSPLSHRYFHVSPCIASSQVPLWPAGNTFGH
nr:hypothetical protein CFP56_49938 [Quercus suber]